MQRASLHPDITYQQLLEHTGVEILGEWYFGGDRGDLVFAVRRPGPNDRWHYGITIVGYGSCTGCDVLKQLRPRPGKEWHPDNQKFALIWAHETVDATYWGTRAELTEQLLVDYRALLQWWGHTPGFYDAVNGLLRHIPDDATPGGWA